MMVMYRTTVRQRELSPIYGCTIHDHYGNTGYEVLILGIQNYIRSWPADEIQCPFKFRLRSCSNSVWRSRIFYPVFFTKLRWVPENSIVGHENCDNKNIEDRADIC